MQKATRRIAAIAMVGLGLGLTSCGATPATPEQTKMAERQLLMPFLQNTQVACAELEIDITPNFHLHVSNPGVDQRLHRFDKEEKASLVEKTWTNLLGDPSGYFKVTVSKPKDPTDVSLTAMPSTTYTVSHQFKLRVHQNAQMAISARASGPVVIVREAGSRPRDVREFAIADGIVRK